MAEMRIYITCKEVIGLRKLYGWSQTELAKDLGLSLRTISNYENEDAEIPLAGQRKLIAKYGDDITALAKETTGINVKLEDCPPELLAAYINDNIDELLKNNAFKVMWDGFMYKAAIQILLEQRSK